MNNPLMSEPLTLPTIKEIEKQDTETFSPAQYHVILIDDDYHTYDYVMEMLTDVFKHDSRQAYEMACLVDSQGFVVVDTTHKDRAELKRDLIHGYGGDWRMEECDGAMSAVVEPAENLD